MANREWTTQFFDDELIPVTPSIPVWTGVWPGRGTVLWAFGKVPNELNRENNSGTLRQPEVIDKSLRSQDVVSWTLFVPSTVLAYEAYGGNTGPPKAVIPVTLLMGRADEEVGYGLRVFFERAGTGALLCLSGREREDEGGRWNVGISQKTVEQIFALVKLQGKPKIEVLAGYSTGYGVTQTINNDLVPLQPIRRLVFFDCIYRSDNPALPSNEPKPTLALRDTPEFSNPLAGQVMRDELKEPFRPSPFNTRRAITRLTTASKGCVVAGYSATSGGSPRYAIWKEPAKSEKVSKMLMLGSRPVIDIPILIELRDARVATGGNWSPSDAFDMLVLCRYLALGTKAGLITTSEPPASFRSTIAQGLPPRGTVVSSPTTKSLVRPLTAPAMPLVDILAWAASVPKPKSWSSDRVAAMRLLRSHELVLPGWRYAYDDLDEFRHAGALSEFGWELLPP